MFWGLVRNYIHHVIVTIIIAYIYADDRVLRKIVLAYRYKTLIVLC